MTPSVTPSTPGSRTDRFRSPRLWFRLLLWVLLVTAVILLYQCPARQYALPGVGVTFEMPWTLDLWRPWGPPLPGELEEEARGVVFRASPLGNLAGIRLRTFRPAPGQTLEEYVAALELARRDQVRDIWGGYLKPFRVMPTSRHHRYDRTFMNYPGIRHLKEIDLPRWGGRLVRHLQYDVYFEAGGVCYQSTYVVPELLAPYYEVYYRWIVGSIRLEEGGER